MSLIRDHTMHRVPASRSLALPRDPAHRIHAAARLTSALAHMRVIWRMRGAWLASQSGHSRVYFLGCTIGSSDTGPENDEQPVLAARVAPSR